MYYGITFSNITKKTKFLNNKTVSNICHPQKFLAVTTCPYDQE
jgi:hypothetical protein